MVNYKFNNENNIRNICNYNTVKLYYKIIATNNND